MAALLTSVSDDKDKSAIYLGECRRMGIKVLPPDVNDSDSDFTPRGTDIRFGLVRRPQRRGERRRLAGRHPAGQGRFADFADFLRKVEPVACNKRTVESLIKAGAFDSLGHSRRGLVQIHAEAIDACLETKRAEAAGQFALFGGRGGRARRRAGPRRSSHASPTGEWDKKRAARLRAGDARALRQRPPAARASST